MRFNRVWIPNSLTMGSLLCGFAALVIALDRSHIYPTALWLIFIASWLDIFDGGVARLLHVNSPFGKQLDSLTDVVTFGVAPGLLMYQYSLYLVGWWGFGATALFVCCGVSRLARYTAHTSHEKRSHFVGMPIGISGVFAGLIVFSFGTGNVWLAAALVAIVSLFMVSTLPFPTPGQIAFQAPIPVRVVIAGIWLVSMLQFHTWVFMPLSYFAYGLLQNLIPVLRPGAATPFMPAQAE